MKWELIAERKNDFMKNCLVYEAMTKEFVQRFSITHPDYLTIRDGMSYSHYWNLESPKELENFIKKALEKDHYFFHKILKEGKEKFEDLINFSKSIKGLKNKTRIDLLDLLKKYFYYYKQAYPPFLISIDSRFLETEDTVFNKEVIDTMAKTRLHCRTMFNKTHEVIHPLFEEIAKRLNTSVHELKFLTPKEIETALKGHNIDIKQKVKQRQKCVFFLVDGSYSLHEDSTLTLHYEKQETNEIKGQGTFPAKYKGKVRIIKTPEDMKKLKKGEIIVAQMTTTDLISDSLKKAGAIITDEGGITCHAAVVSREFNIPALIGTKNATKLLKNGDLVEVDTKKGTVLKILQ